MSYRSSPLVDAYIAKFGGETKRRLTLLRSAIQATFPKTVEDISYGMPTYRPSPGKRGIVHFAVTKDHIGVYAIFEPKGNAPMHKKMEPYRAGRGTLQFNHDQPFPMKTVRQILAYHATKVDMQPRD